MRTRLFEPGYIEAIITQRMRIRILLVAVIASTMLLGYRIFEIYTYQPVMVDPDRVIAALKALRDTTFYI